MRRDLAPHGHDLEAVRQREARRRVGGDDAGQRPDGGRARSSPAAALATHDASTAARGQRRRRALRERRLPARAAKASRTDAQRRVGVAGDVAPHAVGIAQQVLVVVEQVGPRLQVIEALVEVGQVRVARARQLGLGRALGGEPRELGVDGARRSRRGRAPAWRSRRRGTRCRASASPGRRRRPARCAARTPARGRAGSTCRRPERAPPDRGRRRRARTARACARRAAGAAAARGRSSVISTSAASAGAARRAAGARAARASAASRSTGR